MPGIPSLFFIPLPFQIEVISEKLRFQFRHHKRLAQFLLLHTYYFPEHI